MKQQMQGVRSTKARDANSTPAAPETPSDPPEPKTCHNDVYVKVWDTKEKVYTDQTGKFPFQSVSGNRYLMVMVEVDSNYIDAQPMKNRTGKDHIKAYQELLQCITISSVCNPKMHIPDNEASNKF